MITPEIQGYKPTLFEHASSYLFKIAVGREEFHPETFTHAVKTVAHAAEQKHFQPFTVFSAVLAGISIGIGINPQTGEQLVDKEAFATKFGERFKVEALINNQQDFQNALRQSMQEPNDE